MSDKNLTNDLDELVYDYEKGIASFRKSGNEMEPLEALDIIEARVLLRMRAKEIQALRSVAASLERLSVPLWEITNKNVR